MKENDSILALLMAAQNGGGSGGATSLNDLSDVRVNSPELDQLLVYDGNRFVNENPSVEYVGIPTVPPVTNATTWDRRALMGDAASTDRYAWVAFDELPLAYTLKIDDATFASQFNALLTNLKTAAKANGKAGLQIPFAGSGTVTYIRTEAIEGHMSLLRVGTDGASWQFYSLSSVDASHVSFHADHTDADGIYHITAAFTATSAMMSCEYTVCPAMS